MEDISPAPTTEVVVQEPSNAEKVRKLVAQLPMPQYQRNALATSLLKQLDEGKDITDRDMLKQEIDNARLVSKHGRSTQHARAENAKRKATRKTAKASRRRNRGK